MTLEQIRSSVHKNRRRFRVREEIVYSLADIFFGAFGRPFFDNPETRLNPVTGTREVAHPLLKGLLEENAPELGISELLEVALYLREFAQDPALPQVLA